MLSDHRHVFNIPRPEEKGAVTIFWKYCDCGARTLSPASRETDETDRLADTIGDVAHELLDNG